MGAAMNCPCCNQPWAPPRLSINGDTLLVKGRSFGLTPVESDVFKILFAGMGEVVPADELAKALPFSKARALSVHISRLRSLVAPVARIRAVRGQGYIMGLIR